MKDTNKKKLVLIDGANYIFRAYYAIRELATSKGFPTNALYGFTRMLIKIKREIAPDYIAVIFDTKKPTFREEEYKEYKAHRPPPPDDLVKQFPHFKRILEGFRIRTFEKDGFEADDIIATIAKKESGDDIEVSILSGDKDLLQLVDDNIFIVDEMKGIKIGAKEVRDRFGVPPERIIDLLSLSGDSSDNIPGVKGVGLKTAAKLIEEYGSLEDILLNVKKLKGSLVEKLEEGRESALLSKKLVTLKTDVPVEYSLEELEIPAIDAKKLKPLLMEFEFSKLLSELALNEKPDYSRYRSIDDRDDLIDFLECVSKAGILSIDLETDSLDIMKAKIAGFALSSRASEGVYVPVGHLSGKQIPYDVASELISKVLKDPSIKKIGQNLIYDLAILKRLKFEVKNVYFDTMIASYLIDPSSEHNLDYLAMTYLNHDTMKYADVTKQGKKEILFTQVEIPVAKDYASEDADIAMRLYEIFEPRLRENKLDKLFHEVEIPVLQLLVDIELKGMKIDEKKLKAIGAEFEKELKGLEELIYKEAGAEFNINSPKQLGTILFEKLQLSGGKKTKTGYSTDQSVLENLALNDNRIAIFVTQYRSLSKLKGTYVDTLPKWADENGRIHTSFNQAVTATGRLSSSDPNLQNIPVKSNEGRMIRSSFIAEEGFLLLSADYSQIELRLLAHFSNDTTLLQAFIDGLDVHAITASNIFKVRVGQVTDDQRRVGKTVNFSVLYGQTPFGLSRQLKIGQAEAKEYIDNYFKKYPKVLSLRKGVIEDAQQKGYVTTLFGRRRYLPEINSKIPVVRDGAERMAFNTIFQGTAADIMKKAMLDVAGDLKKVSAESAIVMQVHDELVLEVPEPDAEAVSAYVKEKMEGVIELKVPLLVDVGTARNWNDAH